LKLRLLAAFAVLALVGALAAACDDDDDGDATPTTDATTADASPTTDETPATSETPGAEDAAIEDAVRGAMDAYNSGDAEAFYAALTDEGVASFLSIFGLPTDDLEAAKAEAAPFIGEDPIEVVEVTVTEADDSSATAELIGEASGILEGDRFSLVMAAGEWKIDAIELFAVSPEIGPEYATVDMGLAEFEFDLEDETVPAGPVAFVLQNNGEQPHEAVLARVDEGVDILEEIQTEEEQEPEGVEVLGGVFNVDPGSSYNLIFTEELEPGRYAFVCFLPNLEEGPDGTPHALLGMWREFRVE
jgi:hypothetical protein